MIQKTEIDMRRHVCRWALLIAVAGFLAACGHTSRADQAAAPSASGNLIATVYQDKLNHLSAVRIGSCPMLPSCSEYSRQALDRFGAVIGAMMTADRLMRCGRDEMRLAPTVRVNGVVKHYDPIERNNFWWQSRLPAADSP